MRHSLTMLNFIRIGPNPKVNMITIETKAVFDKQGLRKG